MIFNSFQFLWLFPVIFLICWGLTALPLKGGDSVRTRVVNFFLILISYGLYMQWKPAYALLLLGITAVTYFAALFIERRQAYGRRRYIIVAAVVLALLPLLVFKYYNFINSGISSALARFGFASSLPGLNWALPLGISFFTFQAVGYLFDVYRRKIPAEHNWADYTLFICFFPQLLSGPISKASDLLPQIKAPRRFDYDAAVTGMKLILWGLMLKVAMADRLGLFVDKVFDHWTQQSGLTCLAGSLAYSLQIYGDFAGYSFMAVGVGLLLGFRLVNNFNRPYFAVSVTDFWRRWHISLSTWLKDHVYIPLGGSRCSKARNHLNIFLTFLVSGMWHGANWTFIVWGLMHGLFQSVEKLFGLNSRKPGSAVERILRTVLTFALVSLAWVMFRAKSVESGFGMIARIFTDRGPLDLMDNKKMILGFLFAALVIVSELAEEMFGNRFSIMNHRSKVVRWAGYAALVGIILIAGVFDSSQFIYANF